MTPEDVSDSDIGKYLVGTASGSFYLLDLDDRTMRRASYATFPDIGTALRAAVAAQIITITCCRLGMPMVLRVALPLPGLPAVKWTSNPVVSIESLLGFAGKND